LKGIYIVRRKMGLDDDDDDDDVNATTGRASAAADATTRSRTSDDQDVERLRLPERPQVLRARLRRKVDVGPRRVVAGDGRVRVAGANRSVRDRGARARGGDAAEEQSSRGHLAVPPSARARASRCARGVDASVVVAVATFRRR